MVAESSCGFLRVLVVSESSCGFLRVLVVFVVFVGSCGLLRL